MESLAPTRDLGVLKIMFLLNPPEEEQQPPPQELLLQQLVPYLQHGTDTKTQSPPQHQLQQQPVPQYQAGVSVTQCSSPPPPPPIPPQFRPQPQAQQAQPKGAKEATPVDNRHDPHENPRFSLNAVRENRLKDWYWMSLSQPRVLDSLSDPSLTSLDGCPIPGYEHIFTTQKTNIAYKRAFGEPVSVWIIEINDECKSYWPVLPTWKQLLLDKNSPVYNCRHLQPLGWNDTNSTPSSSQSSPELNTQCQFQCNL